MSDPIKYDLSVRVAHKTLGVTAPFHEKSVVIFSNKKSYRPLRPKGEKRVRNLKERQKLRASCFFVRNWSIKAGCPH